MLLLLKKDSRKMDSSNGNRHIRTHLLVDMDRGGGGGGGRNSQSNGPCDNNSNASGCSRSATATTSAMYNDNHCDGIWDPCSSSSLSYGGATSRRDCARRDTDGLRCDNANSRERSGAGRPPPPFIHISGPKQSQDANGSYSFSSPLSGATSTSFRKSGSVSPRLSVAGQRAMMPVSGRQGGCVSPSPRGGRRSLQRVDSRIDQQQFDTDQKNGVLNMMQLDDPKLYIVLHFAEPTSALTLQLTALRSSLYRVKNAGIASEGMLLMNMERNANYPFIVYVVVNTAQTPPGAFLQSYNSIILDELTPDKLNNSVGSNYISGYEEVATIVRPPIDMGPKVSTSPKVAYLITIFKVFPGEDREKLERSWLLWTGARMIYKHLPQSLGLRRITFHKKLWADGGITYMLMCECLTLLDHVTIACGFVEQLRARCCGYTALYKCTDKF